MGILIEFHPLLNLPKLMILRILQRPAVRLKSLRVQHCRLDEILYCEFYILVAPFDGHLVVEPLKVIFCVRVGLHIQLVLVVFYARHDLHVPGLELRLEVYV